MEFLFSHDPLTGLFNRRGFFREIHNKIEESVGKNFILSIYSFDMDNLKQINDNHGHSEGDFSIMAISSSLVKAAEGEDYIIARFGGDEFIAARISEVEADDNYVERFCGCLEQLHRESGKPYRIVASCGSGRASITPDIKIDEVISTADMMMYSEKAIHKRSSPRTD